MWHLILNFQFKVFNTWNFNCKSTNECHSLELLVWFCNSSGVHVPFFHFLHILELYCSQFLRKKWTLNINSPWKVNWGSGFRIDFGTGNSFKSFELIQLKFACVWMLMSHTHMNVSPFRVLLYVCALINY